MIVLLFPYAIPLLSLSLAKARSKTGVYRSEHIANMAITNSCELFEAYGRR